MQFRQLVQTSIEVTAARGRLDKIARLAGALRQLQEHEIQIGVAFLSGSLVQGRIGLGWSTISQARLLEAAAVPSLDLHEVNQSFERIAHTSGAGAAAIRTGLLTELFRRATAEEQDFLMRLLSGDVRQGALEGVLTEAIASAAAVPAQAVRQAAMVAGDLGAVAKAVLIDGSGALSQFTIRLFTPVEPMLASPASSPAEALDALHVARFELKLDGARIQIHKSGTEVRVFSRALNDVTSRVPEVVEAVSRLQARELILDGEVLAMRPDGTPFPFQETMRRFGRRLDIDRMRGELPLSAFVFDCLYVDGRSLTADPLRSRVAVLEVVAPGLGVPHRVISSTAEAEEFLAAAIAGGHEGVMAKALDAPYTAGGRGSSWLKIKQVRTLDLVVLAAEWGSGRRRGWLSNLHLGARDPDRNGFVMLGKTFKGLTDEMLEWQTAALLQREVRREGHVVFVRPELVVEIAFNDVQQSPHYPGALALRFARVKGYRMDKSAGAADTLQAVQQIYTACTGRLPPAVPDAGPRLTADRS